MKDSFFLKLIVTSWPCMIHQDFYQPLNVSQAFQKTLDQSPFAKGVTFELRNESLLIDMKEAVPASNDPIDLLRIAEGDSVCKHNIGTTAYGFDSSSICKH
jgi:hypothetical protein